MEQLFLWSSESSQILQNSECQLLLHCQSLSISRPLEIDNEAYISNFFVYRQIKYVVQGSWKSYKWINRSAFIKDATPALQSKCLEKMNPLSRTSVPVPVKTKSPRYTNSCKLLYHSSISPFLLDTCQIKCGMPPRHMKKLGGALKYIFRKWRTKIPTFYFIWNTWDISGTNINI